MSSPRFSAIHVLGAPALKQFTHRLSLTDHRTGVGDDVAKSRRNHQVLLGHYIPHDPDVIEGRYTVAATGDLKDLDRELLVFTGREKQQFDAQLGDFPHLRVEIAKRLLYQAEINGPLPRIDILS